LNIGGDLMGVDEGGDAARCPVIEHHHVLDARLGRSGRHAHQLGAEVAPARAQRRQNARSHAPSSLPTARGGIDDGFTEAAYVAASASIASRQENTAAAASDEMKTGLPSDITGGEPCAAYVGPLNARAAIASPR
jgi:hypothetical protein